jgi:hypothetical protein
LTAQCLHGRTGVHHLNNVEHLACWLPAFESPDTDDIDLIKISFEAFLSCF